MALNLRKLAKTPDSEGTPPQRRAPSREEPRERPFDYTYGRGVEPPPPGSSWGEFEAWACEDSFVTEDDRRLAFAGWMGRLRWREPEQSPAPAPR